MKPAVDSSCGLGEATVVETLDRESRGAGAIDERPPALLSASAVTDVPGSALDVALALDGDAALLLGLIPPLLDAGCDVPDRALDDNVRALPVVVAELVDGEVLRLTPDGFLATELPPVPVDDTRAVSGNDDDAEGPDPVAAD